MEDTTSECFFEDEFEEFRARALSGGNLPSIAHLKQQQQQQHEEDQHKGHHHHSHHHHHHHHLGSHLNNSSRKLTKSHTWDYNLPGAEGELGEGDEGEDCTTPILHIPVPVSMATPGLPEVSVVLHDDPTTPSEAETESTLVELDQDVGEEEEGEMDKGEEEEKTYVPLPQNLLQSQRYNTQRLSDGGACLNLDKGNTGEPPGEGEGTGGQYTDIQERILSHMSWVVLEDDDWHLGDMRPRVSSMPAKSLDDTGKSQLPQMGALRRGAEGHKVRSYTITPKGVVKKGEVYVNRSSSTSVASNDSESNHSNTSSELPLYRVMVSGEVGVGKRALVHSFLASDSDKLDMCSFDDDDDVDRTVSIILDGEESTLEFIDITKSEITGAAAAGDAYIVVYSVEWRRSFDVAIEQLQDLRQNIDRPVAIILVANKADLVRSRVIGEQEGRSAAKKYDCKYIEVSAAIDHRVEDLLVGTLKQIRLTKQNAEKLAARFKHRHHRHHHQVKLDDTCCQGILRAQQHVLTRLFKGEKIASKSCENLYEL